MEAVFSQDGLGEPETYCLERIDHLAEYELTDQTHQHAGIVEKYAGEVRLGHAKASTTLDIYGHLIPVMQEDATRVMDKIVTPIRVDIGKVSEVNPLPLTDVDQTNGF